MKKKLKLNDLTVKSFKTTSEKSTMQTIKGGNTFDTCATRCLVDCNPLTANGCGGGSNLCGTNNFQCGTQEILTCLFPC